MEHDLDFARCFDAQGSLSASNRPIRMLLSTPDGISTDLLLPQRITGSEAICDGFEYRILCVADDAGLALKDFIALPVELQIVTDRGGLHRICGIVTGAAAGQSDGALATYQLVVGDALGILEKRVNTRIFRNKNELDIIELLLDEWRQSCSVIADTFEYEFDQALVERGLPKREFTMQHNESDAAFIRRLLKRIGIAWFFRAGRARTTRTDADEQQDAPAHTMVMFSDETRLRQTAAGTVRYHRDNATEQRDTITLWNAVRTLQAGSVTRHSWDYANPLARPFMTTNAASITDQGVRGSRLAASLNDYRIETPHAGSNNDDLCTIGRLRMARHAYLSKCYQGEATVRDMRAGEWLELEGHPEIDRHPVEERQFVIVSQRIAARNNLPKEIGAKVERLFSGNGWAGEDAAAGQERGGDPGAARYRSRFSCVRRGISIVPAYDPHTDLPHPQMQSAIVVGPEGEEVHCDAYGRVKIRFPGTRLDDHRHASGAGAADGDADSAWVRVASNWAGNGPGSHHQCGGLSLPRVNSEVLVAFMGGDPDKPVIVGQLYNFSATPPALSALGQLPGNKYLSGMRSREVHGARANTLRFDDTPGQISTQLASDHGASALNLGWLTEPRCGGEGAARGEGAELRSDKAVAVRARQGILLSACGTSDAQAAQLERTNLIGVAEAANSVTQQLSDLATAHSVASAEGDQLGDLLGCVRHWHSGSNVAQGGAQAGGRPILAASAEAGMLLASQDNLALGAQTRIDIASVADTQLSAGRSLFLRAARGLNLIAFKLGMKLVAAGGDLRIEAHDGDIVITCPKKIRLVAGKGIDIEALAIKVVAQGAQADFGGGAITQQSSGPHTIKSSCFDQLGAGDATPEGVKLPTSEIEHDQQVQLTDQVSFEPAPHRKYRITAEDGAVVEGVSDAKGLTECFANKPAFAHYKIELLD